MSRLIDKFNQIQSIGTNLKMPYEVKVRTGISQILIMGDQVCMGDTDFVSIEEARVALEMLVAEFGGKIKWEK